MTPPTAPGEIARNEISVEAAFQLLREQCWIGARPLVPLFGAGISVEAGIPLIGPIELYLKLLANCYEKELLPGQRKGQLLHQFLFTHGWPSRHTIHGLVTENLAKFRKSQSSQNVGEPRELQVATGDERSALAAVSRFTFDFLNSSQQSHLEKLAHEILNVPPDATWWEIFDAVTQSHAGLKDSFFSDLVRDAKPATTHQHAAFLAKVMNWKLILTTNFDELLEQSLRDHSLPFNVYNLPENGALPHPILVQSNRSVIKMHGTAFALLTGALLDEPLEFSRRQEFLEYFPADSLLLVAGYAGSDKRVTNLIRHLCLQQEAKSAVKTSVLWVCRSRPPRGVDGVPGIRWVKYRDAGAFLLELHNQLASSSPPSPTSYVALPSWPPVLQKVSTIVDRLHDERIVVFTRRKQEFGTSAALRTFASESRRDVIWCHLERIPNVDALFAHLQRELRRHDRELPPFALFRSQAYTTAPPEDFQTDDPRVGYLIEALRRGRYLIALDSIGEFGERLSRFEITDSLRAKTDERARLNALLRILDEKRDQIGDSQLAFAYGSQIESEGKGEKASAAPPLGQTQMGVGEDSIRATLPLNFTTGDGEFREEFEKFLTENGRKKIEGKYQEAGRTKNPREFAKDIVRTFWDHMTSEEDVDPHRTQLLMMFCSAFRRSRSVVALRHLVLPAWKAFESAEEPSGDLSGYWDAIVKSLPGRTPDAEDKSGHPEILSADRRALDEELSRLDRLGFLLRQEGGHWWMHRVVKEAVSEIATGSKGRQESLFRDQISTLHDALAVFYYEQVFTPSNDPAALVEYFYHRTRSLEIATPTSSRLKLATSKSLLHRLEDLNAVLWKSRDHLLSQRQADTLIAWTTELADDVVEEVCGWAHRKSIQGSFTRVRRELRATLCDLEAEGRRQKNDFYGCIRLRFRQIRDRLRNKPRHDLKRFEKIWEQLSKEMYGDADDSNIDTDGGIDSQKARSCLTRAMKEARPLVHNVLMTLCSQNRGKGEWDLHEAIEGFRLAEHIVDFCVCNAEMGSAEAGRDSIRTDSLLLLEDLENELKSLVGSRLPQSGESVLRRHGLRVMIRICVRRMDICISRYSLWAQPGQSGDFADDLKNDVRYVGERFNDAMRYLGEFQGLEDRDALHYRCFINTLKARVAYLTRNCSEAYRLLDEAEAVITPHVTGSESSALAVCRTARAECLIKDADDRIEKAFDDDQQTIEERETRLRQASRLAGSYLSRADDELSNAEQLLRDGRPHVKWWTRLYALRSQLGHEWLANSLFSDGPELQGSGQVDDTQTQADSTADRLRVGLDALQLAQDCARQGAGSWIDLSTLAKQYAIWSIVASKFRSQWNVTVSIDEKSQSRLDKILKQEENWVGSIGRDIESDVDRLLEKLEDKTRNKWEKGYFARRGLLMLEAKHARGDRTGWPALLRKLS